MFGSMVDIQTVTAENRQGKQKDRNQTTAAKCSGLPNWEATITRRYRGGTANTTENSRTLFQT